MRATCQPGVLIVNCLDAFPTELFQPVALPLLSKLAAADPKPEKEEGM
jgi:hypothetical protein